MTESRSAARPPAGPRPVVVPRTAVAVRAEAGGPVSGLPRPVPTLAPRSKPNPWRLRFAYGIGGLAGLSALVTAIVVPPASTLSGARGGAATGPAISNGPTTIQRAVQYVQLLPGQTAPAGATVIDASAPPPVTVVTTIAAPTQRAILVRTTQSGKVIP